MKILEVKQLTDFKHLNLFSNKYKDRTGTLKSWIFASRSKEPQVMLNEESKSCKPSAVVIIPFHQEYKKLVMIKEFRVPLGAYQYGFPAGLMDRDEEIEETAVRELKEETGLEIVKIIRRSPAIYSSSGMTDESISLVYVICSGKPSIEWNEDSEDIEVLMISSEDAQKLLETPDIKFDVKSWIVVSTFARTGII
ncbi:MAG: NUDIX hydrolase [Desulfamplus sp.]|nr:NUDIX hydrolase [Desulfamplus sp.]MBF0411903.1 NUDIX hydrolase [Desulfamplus sp.]